MTMHELIKRTPIPFRPHAYQLRAIKFLLEHAVAAIFADVGMGKSAITLAALRVLKDRGIMRKTLIIAPLRACWVTWPDEIAKWADFNDLKVAILHGPKKEAALKSDADIFVINPEGLVWLSLEKRFEKLAPDTLVADELHLFKHGGTQRSKLLKYMLPTFRRRWGLTATPAPNGLMDLHGQMFVLDQGASLGRFITHYRSTYFTPSGFGGYTWALKDGAAEQIYEKIQPYILRMAAEDYLELPERVDNVIRVELPTKARQVYMEMERHFVTILESGEALTTPSAAAASSKLRQIVNGAAYRNAEKRQDALVFTDEFVQLHDAKLDALEELYEGLNGSPLLVAYEFKHDESRLRHRFKDATFFSDFKGPKQAGMVAAWNRGEIPLLVGNPASMSMSLNLQGCGQHIAWFGPTWDLMFYIQFIGRVIRQGNPNTRVFNHIIIAARTVEEAVVKALASKDKTQRALLEALKNYSKEVA